MVILIPFSGCIGFDDNDDSDEDTVGEPSSGLEWTAYYAASSSSLPSCNSDSLGLLYYVANENAFQSCQTSGWNFVDISGPQGLQGATGPIGPQGDDGVDGQTGPTGATGVDGEDGVDGISTLVETTALASGSACASGGLLLEIGPDSDGDGSLSPSEQTSTSILCNGEDSQSGATPTQLTVQSVPSVSSCSEGGAVFKSGLDDGAGSGIAMNGELEDDEVSQTTTFCQNLLFQQITDLGLSMNQGIPQGTSMVINGDYVYFIGRINSMYASTGTWRSNDGIWRSDGTIEGTQIVHSGISMTNFEIVGDKIFHTHDYHSSSPDELYVLNLTTGEDTEIVGPGYLRVSSDHFGQLGGKFFFNGQTSGDNDKLWVSDGTDAGTFKISDATYPSNFERMGNYLYFTAIENGSNQIYRTDGTVTGTIKVTNINPSGNPLPSELTAIGNELWFGANDGVNGAELWVTDGTSSGTRMVKDINSGSGASSNPSSFVGYNGMVYFSANSASGYELWSSDGTSAGTTLVKDINPGSASSWPMSLTVIKGDLFFGAEDEINGYELWISDGTSAGTTIYHEFGFLSLDGVPREMVELNGNMCLQLTIYRSGNELYCENVVTTVEFS